MDHRVAPALPQFLRPAGGTVRSCLAVIGSATMTSNNETGTDIRRTVSRLVMVVVGMFAFGFALVPLYDVFCDITGLNGKTAGRYVVDERALEADAARTVKVQFLARTNQGMSWEFRPSVASVQVNPGVPTDVTFVVRNPTGRDMVAQAVPSVVPFKAADYLHKTECFCFRQQPLEAGAEREMPLRFIVDRDLPDDVATLTLSYALFDITEQARQTVN